ncbi:MAG: NAD(P)H-quinone oxidoreductase [Methylobacteriaceae bacterium]|nr:NAD(P)H-quinone oxidoreductase [Methylobacteriaceae bacterium]
MSDLPQSMTAIVIRVPAGAAERGPEVLVPEMRPVPVAGRGEILLKVAAAGINRPDVMQRIGAYPPPPGAPDIPGLEISGAVVALGEASGRFRIGEKVCGLVPGGGYAEYALVHETNALPVPAGLTMVEATALPETFFTVWTNVFERGGLAAGETLLVHGGTSGIGTTAIMLAKAFGARVVATAGSDEKCAACRRLGADAAVNYRAQDFVAETRSATDGRGADVVLDMVGGSYVERNYQAAAIGGRIVQIAFLEGPTTRLDLRPLMQKRLIHTGSTLRPRSPEEKALIANALLENVWPLLEAGRCKPLIDSTFPLHEASKAHERIDSPDHIGKIVLTL